MARGSRIAQLALIILGFLAFVMMFAVLFGDGADTGFNWTCNDQGNCNGTTHNDPSGFHQAVLLGLLGIGFEVAAVAVGVRGGAAAVGSGAARSAAGGPGAAQAPAGYSAPGTAQPQFGGPSAPFGTGQSVGMGQQPGSPGQPHQAAPQQAGYSQPVAGSPAALTPPSSPAAQPGSPGAGRASVPPASQPGNATSGQGGAQPYQGGYGQQGFPPPYGQQQS
ncbi:MAG: hypothetical protein GEU94_01820 [Micromonosporaceae bacterium]|nr:hypothetical protein [Micromonosporaceae bacterium]